MQTWLVHAAAVPHAPVRSHVSTPLPEHWVLPGAHTPWHAPFTQACAAQSAGVPHEALASHVCTPSPEHCVAPGVHVPVHAPDTQESLHEIAAPQPPP